MNSESNNDKSNDDKSNVSNDGKSNDDKSNDGKINNGKSNDGESKNNVSNNGKNNNINSITANGNIALMPDNRLNNNGILTITKFISTEAPTYCALDQFIEDTKIKITKLNTQATNSETVTMYYTIDDSSEGTFKSTTLTTNNSSEGTFKSTTLTTKSTNNKSTNKNYLFIGTVEDDEPSNGTLIYYNDDKLRHYTGDINNYLPYGKGVENSDGEIYDGEFTSGLYHGLGILTTSKYVYKGQFSQGKKHGKGELKYNTGEYSIGLFNNDIFLTGDIVKFEDKYCFIGKFENGFYKNDIHITCPLGTSIQAKTKGYKSFLSCKGVLNNINESYEGEVNAYVDNYKYKIVKHGFGKVTLKNNDWYEGEFNNDKFIAGKGCININNGIYTGELNDRLYPNGKGTFNNNEEVAEGEWKNGKRHGNFIIKYLNPTESTGKLFNGNFTNNKKHGLSHVTDLNDNVIIKRWDIGVLMEIYPTTKV